LIRRTGETENEEQEGSKRWKKEPIMSFKITMYKDSRKMNIGMNSCKNYMMWKSPYMYHWWNRKEDKDKNNKDPNKLLIKHTCKRQLHSTRFFDTVPQVFITFL